MFTATHPTVSRRFRRLLVAAAIGLGAVIAGSAPAARDATPLTSTIEAHGGIEAWNRFGTLAYTMDGFPLSAPMAKANRSTVDLRSRFNRIDGDGFTVAWNGVSAWSTPGPDAVGLPPRFVTLGSFYFIGMPFVFADDGVVLEAAPDQAFRGREYRVVKVGYRRGVGHSSKDDYTLFIDKDTDRLALIHHSVTETGVERVTWTFDEWQRVDGLLVPARMTLYPGWNPDAPGDGSSFTIERVEFDTKTPPEKLYAAPADAVIDTAPAAH